MVKRDSSSPAETKTTDPSGDGQKTYAFIVLVDDEDDAVGLVRLMEEQRLPEAEAGSVFAAPAVRGLAFIDQRGSPELTEWRRKHIPPDAECAYLIDDAPALPSRVAELGGTVYVRVPDSSDGAQYTNTPEARVVVGEVLTFVDAIMHDFSQPDGRLPQLFDPRDADRMARLAGMLNAETTRAWPEALPAPKVAARRNPAARLWQQIIHSSLRRSTVLQLIGEELAVGRWNSPQMWSTWFRAWWDWPYSGWFRVGVATFLPVVLELTLLRWPLPLASYHGISGLPFPKLGIVTTGNAIPVLTTLWVVEATIYALVVAVTSLMTAVSPSAIDAGRLMMSRYRRNAFGPVAAIGLAVLLITGLETLLVAQQDNSAAATDATIRLMALFTVFLASMGFLILYAQRLLGRTPAQKIRWLEAEVDREQASEAVSLRSADRLTELLGDIPLRISPYVPGPSRVIVDEPVRAKQCWTDGSGPRQLHDIRVGLLAKWARNAVARWPSELKQDPPFCNPVLNVRLEESRSADQVVALLPRNTPFGTEVEAAGLCSSLQWRQIADRGLYESLDELIDRAVTAARESRLEEFDLALAALLRVYQRMRELRVRSGLPTKRLGVFLRSLIQRLGGEVLRTDSESILAAWTAFPQRLLALGRDDPDRPPRPIMNTWLWLGYGANEGRARKPDLIRLYLRLRLDYYSEQLTRELKAKPSSPQLLNDALGLVEACCALLPALEPAYPGVLADIVDSLSTFVGRATKDTAAFWLRYADWDLRDYGRQDHAMLVARQKELTLRLSGIVKEHLNAEDLISASESLPQEMTRVMRSLDWLALTEEEQERDEYPERRFESDELGATWGTLGLLIVHLDALGRWLSGADPKGKLFLERVCHGLDMELIENGKLTEVLNLLSPSATYDVTAKLRQLRDAADRGSAPA